MKFVDGIARSTKTYKNAEHILDTCEVSSVWDTQSFAVGWTGGEAHFKICSKHEHYY
jgi:hypothetical protein